MAKIHRPGEWQRKRLAGYKLKPTTRNCRNCKHYRKQKYGYCTRFKISVSDVTNARLCKGFENKN